MNPLLAERWSDFASSHIRPDKELVELITVAIANSNGTCPFGILAHNEAEKIRLLELLKGKHGAKLIEVTTAADMEAARKERTK